MENKELIWHDCKIHWPNHNTVYYDTKAQIDKLGELQTFFQCSEIVFVIDDINLPAQVFFNATTGELISKNGHIEIFYPKEVQKVNMHINGKKYTFTEEDNIWR